MLACSKIPSFDEIAYPVIAQPKLDGIRCLVINGVPVSRNLKPIPNKFITKTLIEMNLPDLDGELMLKSGDFNSVQSAIMSEHGEPDFVYVVFDTPDTKHAPLPYSERLAKATSSILMPRAGSGRLQHVGAVQVNQPAQLEKLYNEWLAQGFEGAIIRDPSGPYKHGRSTLKQGWMLKLKTFNDAEAKIIGFEELMHNDNEATTDALGHQVRSSHQDNQYGGNTLGSLVCKYNDQTFKIGTGFDSAQRDSLWARRESLIGKLVTFKYQELSKYGIPRFPVYKGLRNENDLS